MKVVIFTNFTSGDILASSILDQMRRVLYGLLVVSLAWLLFATILHLSPDRLDKVEPDMTPPQSQIPSTAQTAIFAGGCFWCMESAFEHVEGVYAVTSGYTGGTTPNPTYQQVASEATGHYEAVLVTYDPSTISYEELLEVFWRNIDPTDPGGQFADRGNSYRTAIFVRNQQERQAAESSKAALTASNKFDQEIVTPILDESDFYPAEAHHQDYYLKNPVRYKLYRRGSGRDAFIVEHWGDTTED